MLNFDKIIAEGNTSEIYDIGESKILKLFKEGYPRQFAELEFYNASTLWKMGVPSPRPYEIAEYSNRVGIIYDFVDGTSLQEALLNCPSYQKRDKLMSQFVDFQKSIIGNDGAELIDYRDFLKHFFQDDKGKTMLISSLPEGSNVLHGDYHPGNVMIDSKGDLVLIDMMNVSRGPAEFDVARTFVLLDWNKEIQNQYIIKTGFAINELSIYIDIIQDARNKGF